MERLIELAPDGAILYALRGLAQAMAGDASGARKDLDRAAAMTDDPEELSMIEKLRMGSDVSHSVDTGGPTRARTLTMRR